MQIIKKITASTAFFLLITAAALADDPIPCSGDIDDPGYSPNGCPVPLDNWVIVLVVAGLVFAMIYLHRKQKREAILL